MKVLKFKFFNDVLDDINPVLIFRRKQRIKHNKRNISRAIILDIIFKKLPILIEELPEFLEYEIFGFQESARNGEFIFLERHSVEDSIIIYFNDLVKYFGLTKEEFI